MGKRWTQVEIIEQFTIVHGDKYCYDKVKYVNGNTPVVIVCPNHGDFLQKPFNHKNGNGCQKCGVEILNNKKIKFNNKQDFINMAIEKHGNFYDYSNVIFNGMQHKVMIKCPNHGYFTQTPAQHLISSCKQCAYENRIGNKLTNDDFVIKSNIIHQDKYSYIKCDYKLTKIPVTITCPVHGDFEQKPNDHLNGNGCQKCAKSSYQISKQEQGYYEFCKTLTTNVEQSNRTILNGKELDISLPEHKLAIEYNGLYWHSSNKKEDDAIKRKQHLEKTELCLAKGIELLHINEGDNVDLWKQVIKNKLGLNKRIYARKTSIRLISNTESNAFLEHNHLQGKCAASIRYGLYHKDKLMSVMTFGKARYSDADWELLRFCTKGGYTVVGGASKLLKMFKTHHEGVIISYANKRWSNGNLYEKLGFEFLHDSAPCYWYIKDNNIWHRSKFMKHKLKNELIDFDPKLSEVENMYLNGYRRIWDCGNKVYRSK